MRDEGGVHALLDPLLGGTVWGKSVGCEGRGGRGRVWAWQTGDWTRRRMLRSPPGAPAAQGPRSRLTCGPLWRVSCAGQSGDPLQLPFVAPCSALVFTCPGPCAHCMLHLWAPSSILGPSVWMPAQQPWPSDTNCKTALTCTQTYWCHDCLSPYKVEERTAGHSWAYCVKVHFPPRTQRRQCAQCLYCPTY